jgi:hypothetical protein
MRRSLRIALRAGVIGVVAAALWWFVREVDVAALGRALASANLGLLVVASLLHFVCLSGKAWAWRILLAPPHPVSLSRLLRYEIVASAASAITPARAGEVLRMWILKRRDAVPVATTAAIFVVHKLLDGATMLMVLTPLPWLIAGLPPWIGRALVICAAVTLALLAALYVVAGRVDPRKPSTALRRFLAGIQFLRSPSRLGRALLPLLVVWAADFAAVTAVLHAIGVQLPLAAGLLESRSRPLRNWYGRPSRARRNETIADNISRARGCCARLEGWGATARSVSTRCGTTDRSPAPRVASSDEPDERRSPPETRSRYAASRSATSRGWTRMSWTQLLSGEDAQRASRAVERLLAGPRARGASLASGDAGIALALAEFAAARCDHRAAHAARMRMNRAIAAMARDVMAPWLFEGFAGVAWVAHHVFGEGSAEVDTALARVARHPSIAHDLYGGLAGLGVYALARPRAGLGHVVTSLRTSAVRDTNGATWETAIKTLPPNALPHGTRRHFNLGIAHGLPGVIGFLALTLEGAAGSGQDAGTGRGSRSLAATSAALLDVAVRGLLAHRLPDGATSCFPGWIDPGVAPLPTRHGWCYGDAAIARMLWLAARAADEPAWRRAALEVARQAAVRPLQTGGAVDAGICHGSAGLGHIFNRHWQATGERVFADAARRWFRRALARIDRVSGGGFLSGRAGVALALLHATTTREPTWDRVLLLA